MHYTFHFGQKGLNIFLCKINFENKLLQDAFVKIEYFIPEDRSENEKFLHKQNNETPIFQKLSFSCGLKIL